MHDTITISLERITCGRSRFSMQPAARLTRVTSVGRELRHGVRDQGYEKSDAAGAQNLRDQIGRHGLNRGLA